MLSDHMLSRNASSRASRHLRSCDRIKPPDARSAAFLLKLDEADEVVKSIKKNQLKHWRYYSRMNQSSRMNLLSVSMSCNRDGLNDLSVMTDRTQKNLLSKDKSSFLPSINNRDSSMQKLSSRLLESHSQLEADPSLRKLREMRRKKNLLSTPSERQVQFK